MPEGMVIIMDKIIEKAVAEVVECSSPDKVYLISQKNNIKGELISFKLCIVIGGTAEHEKLEEQLYTEIDCDVPFDLVLYNADEWDELSEEPGTFAWKILDSGILIYG